MSAPLTIPGDAGWCVIGAGPSGLTALKNLVALGLPAVCLEREDNIGGNWYYGSGAAAIFASTRLISSKTLTAYTDFPMPREWPAYPDHRRCLEYLRAYAQHFGLVGCIRPGTVVERVEPRPDHGWMVYATGMEALPCRGLVIATGHNRVPRFPDIPGRFAGELIHACHYKSPGDPLPIAGRRVLVIGGGNSGCDIAVECSRHAARTVHSTRRGYYLVPRFIRGRPADLRGERVLSMGLPTWLRRWISLRVIDRTIGLPGRHGLPRPDHRLWDTHPVINGVITAQIAAGAIHPCGDVERFDGDKAVFRDGRTEAFDIVICATGYRLELPFIDPQHLNPHQGLPRLFLHALHPERDDLAVCGLIQPDSGQWGLTDLQAQLVARMALARQSAPRAAAWLYRQRQRPGDGIPRPRGIEYVDSPRHQFEIEHHSYRRRLEHLIQAIDRRLRRDGAC